MMLRLPVVCELSATLLSSLLRVLCLSACLMQTCSHGAYQQRRSSEAHAVQAALLVGASWARRFAASWQRWQG